MKKAVVFLICSIVISCAENNSPPECRITSPENRAIITLGDTVKIEVSAWDNEGDIVACDFYLGEYLYLGFDLDPPYSYDWYTEGWGIGEERIWVRVADWGAGNGSDTITIILEE
jgi:chitodextrinase